MSTIEKYLLAMKLKKVILKLKNILILILNDNYLILSQVNSCFLKV